MSQQTLSAAVAAMHAELSRFYEHWLQMHIRNPKNYPMSLPDGEWAEQFAVFRELQQQQYEGAAQSESALANKQGRK